MQKFLWSSDMPKRINSPTKGDARLVEGFSFVTFFSEPVIMEAERVSHVNRHFKTHQELAIRRALATPLLVTYSHQEPSCQLYFGWEAHPDYPGLYVKVVINYGYSPATVITAMITDKPRKSELGGGIRYDIRT